MIVTEFRFGHPAGTGALDQYSIISLGVWVGGDWWLRAIKELLANTQAKELRYKNAFK